MNEHIYGPANQRDFPPERIMRRLFRESGFMLEAARKDARLSFGVCLPDTLSWLLAFANSLGINLHEAVWYKYPGVCFACLQPKNCPCGVEQPRDIPDRERRLRGYRRHRTKREPQTLVQEQALQRTLYGRQNERIFLIQTVSHLGEEMGELAEAFDLSDPHEMSLEMADVFSWLCATATRLDLDLDTLMWQRYSYECPRCHHEICDCPPPKQAVANASH